MRSEQPIRLALIRCTAPDFNLMPPLGILYLASIAEAMGYCVKIFDEESDKGFMGNLLDWHPHVAGFSCVTANFNRSVTAATTLKSSMKSVVTVFGGPHPTLVPVQTMQTSNKIDYVLAGECERAFPRFLDFILARLSGDYARTEETVDSLYYRHQERVLFTRQAEWLTSAELDQLPWPAFHLLDLEFYFSRMRHGLFLRGSRSLPLMATRGCPQRCTFCCRIMGNVLRKRSPEKVIEEIAYALTTYAIDSVWMEDDNFTSDMEYSKAVLRRWIEQFGNSLWIRFANGLRVDRIDDELLDLIKSAGGYHLSFGIESGCPGTLKRMKKRLDLEKATKVIVAAKTKGFLVGANCIVGYPGETLYELRQSVRFFLDQPLDSSAIVNAIPFPGTQLEQIARAEGLLTKEAEDYDAYYFRLFRPNILIRPTGMSIRRLSFEIKRAYLLFYLRPRVLSRIVANITRNALSRFRGLLVRVLHVGVGGVSR